VSGFRKTLKKNDSRSDRSNFIFREFHDELLHPDGYARRVRKVRIVANCRPPVFFFPFFQVVPLIALIQPTPCLPPLFKGAPTPDLLLAQQERLSLGEALEKRTHLRELGMVERRGPSQRVRRQQTKPLIGFLNSASPKQWVHLVGAFKKGLNEVGYVEGQNLLIEYRWAEGLYERLPVLAEELVRRPVSVLVATGGASTALAAKAATTTIPIVFSTGSDPVKFGLVASLNRPGGNATGVSFLIDTLGAKRLVLRELLPGAKLIAALMNPDNVGTEIQSQDLQKAGHATAQQLLFLNANSEGDIDTALRP
jgi:ABC transporter substrate binding protein